MFKFTPARFVAFAGTATVLASALAVPTFASAQPRGYYDTRHHYHRCVRREANNGTAVGAVGGGLATGLLTHSVTGGLIGAGVGAVAGHEIAKNRAYGHC